MDKEFFELIKDTEYCKQAEKESLLREITLRKMTAITNSQDAARARGDHPEVARLQLEVDKILVELRRLNQL